MAHHEGFIDIYNKKTAVFELQLRSMLYQIIAFLCTNKYICPTNLAPKQNSKSVEAIKTILNYIETNLNDEIYLHDIAETVNFEESYVSRLFKKYIGMSCFEYIILCRFNKSAYLLTTTELTITEIAFEVGFKNISYFSNKFKKRYGITPKNYRKQNESKRN